MKKMNRQFQKIINYNFSFHFSHFLKIELVARIENQKACL